MNKLLCTFRKLGYVDNFNEEVITYGLQRITELLIDIFGALLCGAIMGNFFVGFIFEFAYIPLRVYAGGYHASNKKKCKYISWGSMVGCMTIIFYVPLSVFVQHFLIVLSILCVVKLSPVESANKPLSKREKQMFRKRSVLIMFGEVLIYCLFILFKFGIGAKTFCIANVLIAVGLCLGAGRGESDVLK